MRMVHIPKHLKQSMGFPPEKDLKALHPIFFRVRWLIPRIEGGIRDEFDRRFRNWRKQGFTNPRAE